MKKVAIIGSRRLNEKQLNYVEKVASAFVRRGYIVTTGCADGADYHAMIGARLVNPDALVVYLPWWSYNKEYHGVESRVIYDEKRHFDWTESVARYHPAPSRLSQGAFKLMARNYGILSEADIVVAMPISKSDIGGTGQGMRIARDLGKELFTVCEKEERIRLKEFLESIERVKGI